MIEAKNKDIDGVKVTFPRRSQNRSNKESPTMLSTVQGLTVTSN